MSQRTSKTTLLELTEHALVGAGLGVFLAVTAMIGNPGLFALIANNASPRVTMLAFVGVLTSTIAIGSTITGFIFSRMEKS
jgi:hypothetical protein